MKKVINGKRYDTETAEHVATGYSDYPKTDFNYWEEELYRKRTGEFFLYGWGGPASRYSKSLGQNAWAGDSKLIPLTLEAAKKWAELHLDADEYEEIFKLQDGDSMSMSIYVPESIAEEAREVADRLDWSVSQLAVTAIREWLTREKQK